MWHRMVREFFGFRLNWTRSFSDQELEDMWDDDTIDVKNFSRMEEGRAKDEMRQMLSSRKAWYEKHRLFDWADQIGEALWADEDEGKWVYKCTECNIIFSFPNKREMFIFMSDHYKTCKGR